MSDQTARFEADLEAVLDGRAAAPGADAAALALARKLAGLGLAAQSRVRESLRAKLVSRARRPSPRPWISLPLRLPAGLAAACAAAVIFLLVVRPRMPAPPAPAPSAPARTAPAIAAGSPRTPSRKVRPQAAPAGGAEQGPFVSIAAGSPFETHGKVAAGAPFVTVPGRKTQTARGRAVVWEFAHATFQLEERPVRIEELFVKPTL
jgi:hypothetical protein